MTNIDDLLAQIKCHSLFEIMRIHQSIGRWLIDPERTMQVKMQLHLGQGIDYFDDATNVMVSAIVEGIHQRWVSVRNTKDGKRWKIPFACINIDRVDAQVSTSLYQSLDRNTLKVGDYVGWRGHAGDDVFGIVEKLNPKTASVRRENGECWRVAYRFLFATIETQARDVEDVKLIDAEPISD